MIIDLVYQKIERDNQILAVEITSKFKNINSPEVISTEAQIINFEKTDLISNFDLFVLKNVADKVRMDLANGDEVNRVSINISAKSLDCANTIIDVIDGISQYFIFEITETAILDINKAKSFISIIKQAGASIALDDLNNSKQGIQLVKELDIDVVKFVYCQEIPCVNRFCKYIQDVLSFKKDLTIVIENIEFEDSHNYIKSLFPQAFIQGYFLHKQQPYIQDLRFAV